MKPFLVVGALAVTILAASDAPAAASHRWECQVTGHWRGGNRPLTLSVKGAVEATVANTAHSDCVHKRGIDVASCSAPSCHAI